METKVVDCGSSRVCHADHALYEVVIIGVSVADARPLYNPSFARKTAPTRQSIDGFMDGKRKADDKMVGGFERGL